MRWLHVLVALGALAIAQHCAYGDFFTMWNDIVGRMNAHQDALDRATRECQRRLAACAPIPLLIVSTVPTQIQLVLLSVYAPFHILAILLVLLIRIVAGA